METGWKRNTALFLSGQAFSLFGSALVQYAILWHLILKTKSGSMMTLFALCGMLPAFFISPFGGVFADRFNRKYVINAADAAIALASLAAALFFLTGFDSIGVLLVCAAVRAMGQGVQIPAVNALIPQIVPEKHLTRINGINSSIQSGITLLSPIASGALLMLAPIAYIFFIDVVTAAIGISIVFFMVKVPPVPKAEADSLGEASRDGIKQSPLAKYFHELKEGFGYVAKHGLILRLIVMYALIFFAYSPLAYLTSLQVTRDFGADVWRLTAVEITFLVGMTAGGVLLSVWGGLKNRIRSIMLVTVMQGAGSIALGITGNFWVYAAIMAYLGLTTPFLTTPFMVLLQERAEPEYMGRVFGVFTMAATLMMPAGMLLFGPLGDIVPIDVILICSGSALLLLALPFAVSKILREAGKTR
ncbi:MAG: MFS transporter [Spirochaetaceae bacterium]|jgi:DHA3 family macrolide efflux protein-like MFS transporter|nr:MFS transporter [Spirochaetaceae bacterium]